MTGPLILDLAGKLGMVAQVIKLVMDAIGQGPSAKELPPKIKSRLTDLLAQMLRDGLTEEQMDAIQIQINHTLRDAGLLGTEKDGRK